MLNHKHSDNFINFWKEPAGSGGRRRITKIYRDFRNIF